LKVHNKQRGLNHDLSVPAACTAIGSIGEVTDREGGKGVALEVKEKLRKMGLWMQVSQMVLNQTESCGQTDVTVCTNAEETDWVGQTKGEVAHKPVLLHTSISIPCSNVGTTVEETGTKEVR
jgi:hypothetical protein